MSRGASLRVAVTGATGFIGRHAVEALREAGLETVGMSRSGDHASIKCDLLDQGSIRRAFSAAQPTHLLHLAWHDHPQQRWLAVENLDWVSASLCLAREFADCGGKRMVFGGSSAQYAWCGERLSEMSRQAPSTLYGEAKSATERLLLRAAPTLGLSVASARIFFCYGAGEQRGRLVSDLVSRLHADQITPCTDGEQRRDYLYAVDVGAALASITTSSAVGGVNVASGKALRVRALIEEVARQIGKPDLVEFGAKKRPADDPPIVEADIAKLHEMGFAPRFTLEAGVADMLRRLKR
jgi:nucleoside-diphosphate-sugar epimerase